MRRDLWLWFYALVMSGWSLAATAVEVPKSRVKLDASRSMYADVDLNPDSGSAARVRIPLQLIAYEQLKVTDAEGHLKIQNHAKSPMKHHLRARLDRPNHFYIANWHIESNPVKWDQLTHQFQVQLRFFQRLGDSQDMEEALGSMDVAGILEGTPSLMTLKAQGEKRFVDRQNIPLLDVILGHTGRQDVARSSLPQTEAPTKTSSLGSGAQKFD